MDVVVVFYRDVLGLKLKFRDADRWAAFDVNGFTFALEGSEDVYRVLGVGSRAGVSR